MSEWMWMAFADLSLLRSVRAVRNRAQPNVLSVGCQWRRIGGARVQPQRAAHTRKCDIDSASSRPGGSQVIAHKGYGTLLDGLLVGYGDS